MGLLQVPSCPQYSAGAARQPCRAGAQDLSRTRGGCLAGISCDSASVHASNAREASRKAMLFESSALGSARNMNIRSANADSGGRGTIGDACQLLIGNSGYGA